MQTRRTFLRLMGGAGLVGLGVGGYAVGVEPFRLVTRTYGVRPPSWPRGMTVRIAILADIHVSNPWMSAERLRGLVEATNALGADVIVLLGDYVSGHRFVISRVSDDELAAALSALTAPLGVYAILGNHDWWEDPRAQARGIGPVAVRIALEKVGMRVLENDVVRLEKDGRGLWLAGLGDQVAFPPSSRDPRWRGVDNLPGTLAKVTDDAPVILLVHEPDIFPQVPRRVSLTLAGHTHGGQVRLFGYSPVVPSRFGNRYAYGYVVERDPTDGGPKQMVVSAGVGISILPVRLGVPPEIVVVTVSAPAA